MSNVTLINKYVFDTRMNLLTSGIGFNECIAINEINEKYTGNCLLISDIRESVEGNSLSDKLLFEDNVINNNIMQTNMLYII